MQELKDCLHNMLIKIQAVATCVRPPREKELTQIEQLVEHTVRLQQMEDDYGVDMADVFLKSCGILQPSAHL